MSKPFPKLDSPSLPSTVGFVHGLSKELGAWCKHLREKRKHWWHASLRPSLAGLTTGPIYADFDFEVIINLRTGHLEVQGEGSLEEAWELEGHSVTDLAGGLRTALGQVGLDTSQLPDVEETGVAFAVGDGVAMARGLTGIASALTAFRAGIREETSPIQLWSHHFDLSMIWLPGEKIPGQDPDDEEYSDKQMNFGFAFGDEGIPEPYFYVTAYPARSAMRSVQLPAGAGWNDEGFDGVQVPYTTVSSAPDPQAYLLELWGALLAAGRVELLDGKA